MIVREIVQRIQSLYSKGVQSDDSRLTSRHIYNKMLTVRSRLLSQKIKKKQAVAEANYVVLSCIELEKVEPYDCPCLPQLGCKVYRTKERLPRILTDLNGEIIDWVFSLDNSLRIDRISREAYLRVQGNRYTPDNARYILEDGYAYFYGRNLPKVVKMKFLPEDPYEVLQYPSACPDDDTDCTSPLDMDFPIDGDLMDTMIEMSVNELLVLFSQANEDQTNNTKDNVTEQSK